MRKNNMKCVSFKTVRRCLLVTVTLLLTLPVVADDDIMITRDGAMIPVKIETISSSQVTFTDLKHKKRGRLKAPADFVYMILKEKGNNIFFDEEGNQTTSPAKKIDKKDNVLFLNRGELLIVYNVSVSKNELSYQLKDKKKAPIVKVKKSDVFMIRNSDGTTTLYNDSYQERRRQAQAASQPAPQAAATVSAPVATPTATPAAAATAATAAVAGQQLLASNTLETGFSPAPNMAAIDIEKAVNAKNPYTLYRKGSVAEYCFQYKGKQTQYAGGPTYYQQIVTDEKIENGLLVAHIQCALFNKKHEPSKGISAQFKETIFPVEIDTAGTYHLTHNLAKDFFIITKRRGYGVLIPGDMQIGAQLKTSSLSDNAKNLFGGSVKVETTYSDWKVEGLDKISTPAGTFDCVKLTGRIAQKQGSNGKFVYEQVKCWMARGVGIVQYETVTEGSKSPEPFIFYLNKLELK